MRKVFTLTLDRITPHNTALLKPVGSDVKIVAMYTTSSNGETVQLLDKPIEIETFASVRYPTVVSSTLWVEIEGRYINELSMNDVLGVQVSMAEYKTLGSASFPDARMVFHKYLSLAYAVEDVKDVYIQATLGVRTLDKYDNIIYSEDIELGLNADNKMVAYATTGSKVVLQYMPSENSVEVIMEGDRTHEFTVTGRDVNIDIPEGASCYVIYRPSYLDNGVFTQITDNVSMNSNNEIELRDDQCSTLIYALSLRVFNTDLTSTNHTPIIKSLAVVSSDQ